MVMFGYRSPEEVDMNGRFQMQGGKNWILSIPSLAGQYGKPICRAGPGRRHRLVESILGSKNVYNYRLGQPDTICRTGPPGYIDGRNRFLGSLNVYKYGLWLTHTSNIERT
jgi:hypothetical protein